VTVVAKRGRPSTLPNREKCEAIVRDFRARMDIAATRLPPKEKGDTRRPILPARRQERIVRELAIIHQISMSVIERVLAKVGKRRIQAANELFLKEGVGQKNLKQIRKMKRQKG
jgi:hypothetical protein